MSPALHRHTPTLAVVDPRGLAVRAVEWHRITSIAPAEPRITGHRFDAAGRSIAHQDPRFFALGESGPINLSSIFSLSGQVLASDNIDAGRRIGLLADDGLPEESWDSRGGHRQFEYDGLRRPVAIVEPTACVERFSYGAADAESGCNLRNRCIRHDDPAGARYFSGYDLNGLVQEERQRFLKELQAPDWPALIPAREALLEPGEGLTTRRRYLPNGELAEQIDVRGNRLQQHYSVAGRLASSELQPTGLATVQVLVSDIRYNAFAQVERQVAGNGIVSLNEYDPASGYLQRLQCRRESTATTLQDLHYAYDPAGNVIRHEDQSVDIRYHANRRIEPVNTYAYDTLYQLISATGRERIGAGTGPDLPEPVGHGPIDPSLIGAYTRRYDYDAGGNLLLMQHSGQNNQQHTLRMAVSEASNKALPWREGLDTTQIENAFDRNGNARELQAGQALEWDARNQLQRVTPVRRAQGEDDSETYVYGGGGQRLRKYATQHASGVSHISETRYLPGIELHSESATGQTWQVINIEAGRSKIRLLHWQDSPPEGLLNDQLYYGFDNHLGSSTIETDEAGQLCSREEYYPFGGTALLAARNALEVSFKTIRYSGKERDATGLYYYGFRYLAPWLQRWINPDPAGAIDGLNLFAFVGNNPLTVVDRDGLMMEPDDELTELLTNSLRPPAAIPAPAASIVFEHLISLPPARSRAPSVESLSDRLFPLSRPPSPAESIASVASSLSFPEGMEGLELPEQPRENMVIDSRGFDWRVLTPAGPRPSTHVPAAVSTAQPGTMLPPRTFKCDIAGCGKSFPRQAELKRHIRTHTKEKPYSCWICTKTFADPGNLAAHRKTHTGVKTHQCPDCEQRFSKASNLKRHSSTAHSGAPRYMCAAPGCYSAHSTTSSLRRHSRNVHSQK